MGTNQRKHALQPVPVQCAFLDQSVARKRRPVHEGLPARAAEGEPRQRREQDCRERSDHNSQPAPIGDQHDRKQQTELRFVGEKPETDPGQRRMPLQQAERAADQCRGEEAVLPGGDIPDRGGKSEREQNAGAKPENAGDRCGVSGERRQKPNHRRGQIRQRRQHSCEEKRRRRIMPAVIAVEIVADRAHFGGAVQRPVVGSRSRAVEREPPGRPDIDEIISDRPALRVGQKVALQIRPAEDDQIAERQRQSDQLDRPLWRELRRGARRDLVVLPVYRSVRLV
jgi:hypothetical protein